MTKRLLDLGAVQQHNRRGSTPLHIACRDNAFEYVEVFLENNAEWLQDSLGCTPLSVACKDGNIEIVEYLIDQGYDLDSDDSSMDAMLQVCCTGNIEIGQMLLESSQSPEERQVEDCWMFQACQHGFIKMVELLIAYGGIPGAGMFNSLSAARESGNWELITLLLEHGAYDGPFHEGTPRLFLSS